MPSPASTVPSAASLALVDLPDEVLALIVSLGLNQPCDVASFAAASKRCAAVVQRAPLRVALTVRTASPSDERRAARRKLQALCSSWPGTAEINARGLELGDSDVQAAMVALPGLQALHLARCTKLTPALLAALAHSMPAQLRSINLQRCFQLTAAAVDDVLAAAALPASSLSSAALSHLDLGAWPEAGASLPCCQLRMLALHNCSNVGLAALRGLAAACPRLEVLMLGGASFAPEDLLAASEGGDAALAPAPAWPELDAVEAGHLRERALEAARRQPALHAATSGWAGYVAAVAAQLALLVRALPRLQQLEVTFMPAGVAAALQELAATEPLLLAGRVAPVRVWDLATPAGVGSALRWRREVLRRRGAGCPPAAAGALLRAAASCSGAGRQTPLHLAAEEGDPALLRTLLGLGAPPDARDRGGATPLFLACEAGRPAGVECLLGAGAALTLKNRAGEAPLYIAALKGHEAVVDVLLQHCQRHSVAWQAHRDGDAWTPLMAAALGGHTAVVLKLLHAAGQEAAALVQAANRYGQTTLHIAARKGSASLLRALVSAGGADSLLHADAEGRTAAEVARSMRNGSALRVLGDASGVVRREAQRQRGTVPTAERPRPNDHRQQGQRWVGRRLQQRKGGSAQGAAGH